MMARVRDRARAIASSRLATSLSTPFVLVRYLAVGGFVGLMDLGTMQLLLFARASVFVATTASYLLMGVGLHFTINKLVTFRNLERSTLHLQARTYAAVTGLCYVSTIAIVEGFTRSGLGPLLGKAVGIVVNVPLAFFCNKTFTFAPRRSGGTTRPDAET